MTLFRETTSAPEEDELLAELQIEKVELLAELQIEKVELLAELQIEKLSFIVSPGGVSIVVWSCS